MLSAGDEDDVCDIYDIHCIHCIHNIHDIYYEDEQNNQSDSSAVTVHVDDGHKECFFSSSSFDSFCHKMSDSCVCHFLNENDSDFVDDYDYGRDDEHDDDRSEKVIGDFEDCWLCDRNVLWYVL